MLYIELVIIESENKWMFRD